MRKLLNATLIGLAALLAPGTSSAFEAGTLKWAFATGDDVVASPTVGADGTVYVGSTDGKLYAINPNGTAQWSFTTGGDVWSSVAIGRDGTLYFGSGDGHIYALHPDGSLKWAFPMQAGTFSTPAVGVDGTVYVGSLDKNLYAITPDGALKWAFPTGGTISSSPAQGADGTVYVGSADHFFYALDPNGGLKWSFESESWMDSPTLAPDGTIYVGSGDQHLYAFNPDGSLKWAFRTADAVWGSAALGADGTVYFGSAGRRFYAVRPDGGLKWSFETGNWVNASPVIGPDGTVYVGCGDRLLYAFNPNGTLRWTFPAGDPIFSSPALGPDGTVYFGTWSGADHHVYAVHGDGTPAGTRLASTDPGQPFEVAVAGSAVFGQGLLPYPPGGGTPVSFAGDLDGGELSTALVHYTGPATYGLGVYLVVGTHQVGLATLRLTAPGQAVLDWRMLGFDLQFTGLSDGEVMDLVYRTLFGRLPDPGGLAYYLGRLASGASTRETIVADVLGGAQGADADLAAGIRLSGSLPLLSPPR